MTSISTLYMTSISTLAERRIDDFYLDLRDYVALVFDDDPEEVSLDWNCVGATLSYRDDTHNIFIRLRERSEVHLDLPDMTMIVETVVFDRKLGARPNPSHATPTSPLAGVAFHLLQSSNNDIYTVCLIA